MLQMTDKSHKRLLRPSLGLAHNTQIIPFQESLVPLQGAKTHLRHQIDRSLLAKNFPSGLTFRTSSGLTKKLKHGVLNVVELDIGAPIPHELMVNLCFKLLLAA